MINIVWSQASTKRGAIWIAGSLISFLFLAFSSPEKAMAVMTITSTVAGGLGVAMDDKQAQ